MKGLTATVVSCFLSLPVLAFPQQEAHGAMSPDQIGSAAVKFETSCAPAVKDDFNKAVALLHSFWFPETIKVFEGILARDATCAMAYWGLALGHWGNPFAGIKPARTVDLVKASIDRAKTTGAPSPRERAYIDAVAQLVTASDPGSHSARTAAYEAAMEKLSREHPGDTEARIFYALAVNQTAQPTDKTYVKNLQAAGILEPLFRQMPTHPGLAHYIIHAYDAPPLAERALDAARRYASLAPSIPHALHMPSHTFTRVGSWTESIETNRRSAEAARKNNGAGEELHALDYQTYAYLQIAQDKAAKAVVDRASEVVSAGGTNAFATAAIPARYALERGAWADAAALPPRPAPTPYTEAITVFARALGAARGGSPGAAGADIEQLAALREKQRATGDAYWTEQIDIQRRVALAWQTFARGSKDEGLAQLRAAADAEDLTDKSAVSPGPLAPARELLGEMLLEAGRAEEALVAFEATMKKEPNRFRGISGGARAAETLGNRAKATAYYQKLVEVAKDADTARPELQHARTYLMPAAGQAQRGAAGDPDKNVPNGGIKVAGWQARLDLPNQRVENLSFAPMGTGMHVTTGPAAIFWKPDQTASGPYTVKATFALTKLPEHQEAYGLFIGGSDLAGPGQKYTYFLLREDGTYLIKRRNGAQTPTIVNWTGHPAIAKPEGSGLRNEMSIQVSTDTVRFLVNGTEVARQPASSVDTRGIAGIRVNHNLDAHIEGFAVQK